MSPILHPGRSRRRYLRRGAALALAAGLTGGTLLVAGPSGAGLPPDLRVIDSHASAAALGILSRLPAESDGGVLPTTTSITLDKTQAAAAGFTLGELVELFLASSSDQYRNPALIKAQFPPSGTVPAENSLDGVTSPPGAPAAGGVGQLHAVATDTPAAAAEAAGAAATLGVVTVGGATSMSSGELAADGTLVTRASSTVADVRIAGVLTLAGATTVAEARVPRSGAPTTTLDVKLTGVALAGIPAEITPGGLRISDQTLQSPVTLAQFNAALDSLQAQGITVVAAPLVEEAAAGAARASGGGVTFRYKVADQIGGDEELTLASASARSALSRREVGSPAIDGSQPGLDGPMPPFGGGVAGTVPVAVGASPGSGTASTSGPDPFTGAGGRLDAAPAFGSAAASGSDAVPATADPSSLDPSFAANSAASGVPEAALSAAHQRADPARRVRSGYAVLLLAAFAGVTAVTAQFRIRPA